MNDQTKKDNSSMEAGSFVEQKIKKWAEQKKNEEEKPSPVSVITISREPGAKCPEICEAVATLTGFELYHGEIISKIAQSADISASVVKTVEKERYSGIEDFIASIVDDKYLWPGIYLEHLMKVISVIAKHGSAVIVGRGANFILPQKENLRIRLVAPIDVRIKHTAQTYGVSEKEAKKRILKRESKRTAFIQESFHEKIADPTHYDLVLNTATLSTKSAAEIIVKALEAKNASF